MAGRRSASAAPRDRDVGSFDRRLAAMSGTGAWSSTPAWWHPPPRWRWGRSPTPAAVLDVGCGTGALLRTPCRPAPAGVELSGVDPAPAVLEVGRATLGGHSQVRLARAVAERLPFRDARFDLMASTVSFAHWTNQPAGLAEVARVLRPWPAGAGRPVRHRMAAPGHRPPAAARCIHTAAELEAMLTRARLAPLAWQRVYDLGPPAAGLGRGRRPRLGQDGSPGAGYSPGGNW